MILLQVRELAAEALRVGGPLDSRRQKMQGCVVRSVYLNTGKENPINTSCTRRRYDIRTLNAS